MEYPAAKRWQFAELGSQTRFDSFEHHRYDTGIGDFETREGVLQVFRPKGPEVNDGGTTNKGSDEAHHEVDGMVRWQDAEILHCRPERVPRHQRLTLFKVIVMRQHATLGATGGARRIHNTSDVVTLSGNESRFGGVSALLPATCPAKVSTLGGLGD